jgi:hypothetical protein
MRFPAQQIGVTVLVLAATVAAAGQVVADAPGKPQDQPQSSLPPVAGTEVPAAQAAPVAPAVDTLLEFKDSDVKFVVRDLMDILKDNRHEGWVLAAYPDPKTHRPLIGAGFSLDLAAREHLQRDPLNPHPFLEPSSAELWQAAGLDPERLQIILNEFRQRFKAAGSYRRFRIRMGMLAPQITDEEASRLLRIAVIQAIYNARGYCRGFDGLTASQQMALSQLVFQMGVSLEEFSEFLRLMNPGAGSGTASGSNIGISIGTTSGMGAGAGMDLPGNAAGSESFAANSAAPVAASADPEYWRDVQRSLIQSEWAKVYRARAISVIAMLDPQYTGDPAIAERRVSATLRPAVAHRHGGRSKAGRLLITGSRDRKAAPGHKARRARAKRKA